MGKVNYFFGVFLLGVLVTKVAHAQECEQSANEAFHQGLREANDGNVEEAIARFRCSYQLDPAPSTLVNIASCQLRMGDVPRAIETLRQILVEFPEPSQRIGLEEVEQQIADLESFLRQQEQQAAAPQTAGDSVEFNTRTGDGSNVVNVNGDIHIGLRTTRVIPTRTTRGRKAAWALFGAGAVVTALGAALLIRSEVLYQEFKEARSYQFDVDDDAGWTRLESDLRGAAELGESLDISGWVLTASGLAIVCASILLLALIPGEESILSESDSRFGVRLSPTSVGFAGSF